jgi:predicted DsbA family dithiol-disulfide isomerase
MHDRLFASQSTLGRDNLSTHAGALGLDVQSFQRCLDSDKYAVKIRQDLAEAQKMSIRATPSFLLGVAKPDGSGVTVVKMIAGAHPYTVFKEAIDSLLSIEKPVAPKRGSQ